MAFCPICDSKLSAIDFIILVPRFNHKARLKCRRCSAKLQARNWVLPFIVYFVTVFLFLLSIPWLSEAIKISSSILFIVWIFYALFGQFIYSFYEFVEI